ncbi:MarR family winged helix-turn-helix transcriptional regulator [Rhizobium sp.]|uniref:MarR family winged helix-turn-helix transcriptional regulator n=1 Tax=Rhizobium sp. TaxID=391 RepID=UPI002EE54559
MSRELIQTTTRLTDALRKSSALALMVSHNVAAKVGLNMTDLECLDIIQMSGSVTAGELARRTGLSTGAMTTAIDRLVHAGYAERQDDPNDRRKVLVTTRAEHMQTLWQIYAPLQAAMERLYEGYSEDELRTIATFMEQAATVSTAFARSLQAE